MVPIIQLFRYKIKDKKSPDLFGQFGFSDLIKLRIIGGGKILFVIIF